jgi:Lon protease-like protein
MQDIIPVFPLTGSLLLPGNLMPLNIYEPRYRNMVADAVAGDRWIGMIQPAVPRQDNRVEELAAEPDRPDLYGVGCLGRIDVCEPQPDGRYVILLRGIIRFRVREELPLHRGYRRVVADYDEFVHDRDETAIQPAPEPLLAALRTFGDRHGLAFDYDLLASVPGVSLLNGLAVALPFSPADKQALLEARGPKEREAMLLCLMGMGMEPLAADDGYTPPVVH